MVAAIRANPYSSQLFDGGQAEVTLWGDYKEFPSKARLDYIHNEHLIVDLKTVAQLTPRMSNHLFDYGYHIQAAWYSRLLTQVTGKPNQFVFVFVEKKAPYTVKLFMLHNEFMDYAQSRVDRLLEVLRSCKETNNFTNYTKIETLELPAWA